MGEGRGIISWWSAWGERAVIGLKGPGGGGDWGSRGELENGIWNTWKWAQRKKG